MAADAISAARPGARRENMRATSLPEAGSPAPGFEGVESSYAVQAGREVRILVQPDKVSDDQVILLARNVAKKIENELDYPGQIKVSVIREPRALPSTVNNFRSLPLAGGLLLLFAPSGRAFSY